MLPVWRVQGGYFHLDTQVINQTALPSFWQGVGYFSATEPFASGQTSSWTSPELRQSHLKSLIKNLEILKEVFCTFFTRLLISIELSFPLSLSTGKLKPFSAREGIQRVKTTSLNFNSHEPEVKYLPLYMLLLAKYCGTRARRIKLQPFEMSVTFTRVRYPQQADSQ